MCGPLHTILPLHSSKTTEWQFYLIADLDFGVHSLVQDISFRLCWSQCRHKADTVNRGVMGLQKEKHSDNHYMCKTNRFKKIMGVIWGTV